MTSAEPIVELDALVPTRLAVGQGQYQLIRGTVQWDNHVVQRITLSSLEASQYTIELFPADSVHSQAFFIRILWLPENIGEHHTLSIEVVDTENTHKIIDLGSIELISDHAQKGADAVTMGDQPLITICMATYAPAEAQFARQLESILCQSYENWLLIVCDDGSPAFNWRPIQALCDNDPRRIRLYRHDKNLGFYHNFERALGYVPSNTEYIAFSDQDDVWYPDKLQS